jgi:hypothetical protein
LEATAKGCSSSTISNIKLLLPVYGFVEKWQISAKIVISYTRKDKFPHLVDCFLEVGGPASLFSPHKTVLNTYLSIVKEFS